MRFTVFDLETDGLLDTVTKIHCLSYRRYDNGTAITPKITLFGYVEIAAFLLEETTLVGHNIICYDIPVIEKILRIKVKARLIDTLGLSWYLYPLRIKHGLEVWGEELGVKKPVIEDWENLTQEEYAFRCESDIEINFLLFEKQMEYLFKIYDSDISEINNIINYLGFKLDCIREQEEVKVKVDRVLINKSLNELYVLRDEKKDSLVLAMPLNIKYKEKNKPSKMRKQDGSYSAIGIKWFELLIKHNLPIAYEDSVMVKILEELGNPASPTQLKTWLFSLGWQPRTFESRKNSKGEVKEVPQIYNDSSVCDSIKELYEIEPSLEKLDTLSLINHRIGVFKSFLANMDFDNYTTASIRGFTNTLRVRHVKPIANLPSIYKFYGKQIRGAVIKPSEEHILCGSDMSSLEDSTKQHYMYYFDPDYVEQMRVPGFDPHLDIAVLASMLTHGQAEDHKLYSSTKGAEGEDHSFVRGKAKVVNFSGVYGAGPSKIAQAAGLTLRKAQQLHKTYWIRNKAVKQVAASVTIKTIGDQMWLLNPVSGFWYSLRFKKDIFSTLNQGTGVYCFDTWVREVRSRGIKVMLQYHDEIAFPLIKEDKDKVEKILTTAIDRVNEVMKLNVPLGISVDFGNDYSEIH